jgi:hypothetical protein
LNISDIITREGESPVEMEVRTIVSRVEHEEFCLKKGGPPSKPKICLITDGEQVL